MPPRFFCSSLPVPALSESADSSERFCTLGPDETRHARKVLRLPIGASIEVFDGSGRLADAEVVEYLRGASGGQARCRLGVVREAPESLPRLTVATAIPKGPRAETMVNQLGQLGADVLVPVRSERSVVEPGAGKVERYEKVALASAKQSGRPRLMVVEPMATLDDVLARPCGMKLILDPRGQVMAGLTDHLRAAQDVLVLVGPEGGWSEVELAEAQSAGCVRWRLAEHVLRIETAATAAVSILRYLTA